MSNSLKVTSSARVFLTPTVPHRVGLLRRVEKDPNLHKGTASEEGDTDGVFIYSAEEERRVKRKIDLILLPLLCMCYVFSVRLPSPSLREEVCFVPIGY